MSGRNIRNAPIAILFHRTVEIPFATAKHASIAQKVIEVDAELNPQSVKRELSVHDDKLIALVCRAETSCSELKK